MQSLRIPFALFLVALVASACQRGTPTAPEAPLAAAPSSPAGGQAYHLVSGQESIIARFTSIGQGAAPWMTKRSDDRS